MKKFKVSLFLILILIISNVASAFAASTPQNAKSTGGYIYYYCLLYTSNASLNIFHLKMRGFPLLQKTTCILTAFGYRVRSKDMAIQMIC